ncbi:thioredoxin, mitochondrial [Bombus impatiens]|uniref:Thioredoxin, mitochondrial n=1 Tax=Bombus impatiens TaxID=132113 RepID=A0A6P3V654_BOMIM|nr:thioredoxin, mitochondrial [Bombus impatiens]XP_012249237.1 thioredoxin, mitochondrial [Bombus impatiens]XP_033180598.1 thioredoxin, mitochondrial [Bombus impatiens]
MLRSITKLSSALVRFVSSSCQKNKQFEINNNSEFVSKVMNSSVPVIVNFHAEWCDPCKILTPKLIELIGPMDKLNLAIVNLESNPELVHIFEVKAVPAIIAISSGLVVDKFVGLTDLDIIENLIQKLTNTPKNSENDKGKI